MLSVPVALFLFATCNKESVEEQQQKNIETYLTNHHYPISEEGGVYYAQLDAPFCDTAIIGVDTIITCWQVEKGGTVQVEYVAYIVNGSNIGSVYATSLNDVAVQNSMEPVKIAPFVVGKGEVIDGLDKGVQRMSYGEHGLLMFPFTQGYGKLQVGMVPSESALAFEVWIVGLQ
jgi:hypothetical protein